MNNILAAANRLLQELGVMETEMALANPLVMFHPGVRYWFKAWPADKFAATAAERWPSI